MWTLRCHAVVRNHKHCRTPTAITLGRTEREYIPVAPRATVGRSRNSHVLPTVSVTTAEHGHGLTPSKGHYKKRINLNSFQGSFREEGERGQGLCISPFRARRLESSRMPAFHAIEATVASCFQQQCFGESRTSD